MICKIETGVLAGMNSCCLDVLQRLHNFIEFKDNRIDFIPYLTMYIHKIPEDFNCGIVIAMKVFGAKWKPCILDTIRRGYKRPTDIHKQLSEATPRVLDMQLRELEQTGIVEKKVFGRYPLHTEYNLTEVGKTILPIIDSMDKWGMLNKHLFTDEQTGQLSPLSALQAI